MNAREDETPIRDDDDELAPDELGESSSESPEIVALRARAARADELEAQLQRAEADFVNESKRLRRLSENDKKYAIERVVVDLIPLVDSLHSAGVGLVGDSEAEARVREGLELVGRQLMDVLGRHGVALIDAEGAFDPNLHEAIYTVPTSDVAPQTIVEVLRPGFALHGRVVRPAEVAVSTAAQPAGPEGAGEDI